MATRSWTIPRPGTPLDICSRTYPPGLLPQEITDKAPDKKARAHAWPKAIEFIRQLPWRLEPGSL
jgi:hypothetical protein